MEGICGGGTNCRPGEISLAHNGVLFLDEAAEFRTSVLQMLRVPLERGGITLSRAGRTTVYPANFQLLMAVNPCPCGVYGSKTKVCLCSLKSVEQYWKKFSAPLLDRIDIRIFVDNEVDKRDEEKEALVTTAQMRKGIARAINVQRKRQGIKNSRLMPQDIAEFCSLSAEGEKILEKAVNRYGFSARAIASCLKIARTIADVDGFENIGIEQLNEAIEYRKLCNGMVPEF